MYKIRDIGGCHVNVKAIWEGACSRMREEMTEVTYSTWIAAALRPLDFADDRFYVEAVTDFYHQFVVPRYSDRIAAALREVTGRDIRLTIMTPRQAEEYRSGANPLKRPAPQLNDKYTFDTFVVGSGNRFAHAASLAVAEAPAEAYNPLFIYGGVGLGKTHLMQAIGHYVLRQKPDTRLVYVTSETFTIELVSAIQTNRNAQFRDKYRNVDVLLIDDIQFIAGRDSTQEEFFHTFNALHNARKQIIISSDRPPKEITRLEERLRSRFEWGLIADIQRPDMDTRCAILRRKAQSEGIRVEDDVLQVIAERVSSNIRELEGSLTRLVAYSSLTGREITMQVAEEALREVFSVQAPRSISCEDVLDAVSQYYAVSDEDLRGPRRTRALTVPRQMVMYLSRKLTNTSLPRIGEVLGGRDHSTVLHGCAKIEELSLNTHQVRAAVEDITKILRNDG
ncbi:MAG: chromosomal replication initiator protein DnaA [Clostridiales bacterium]|nr:chromosomal replication initiator protein DnaA [Clostridiales bacterium]